MGATLLLTAFSQHADQGWAQLAVLGLALVLSSVIGSEREARQRSAGLRTYTLVGFGAALVMLVTTYGFGDVLVHGYFIVVFAYTPLVHRLPASQFTLTQLQLEYVDQQGVLRRAVEAAAATSLTISNVSVARGGDRESSVDDCC